MNDTVLLTLVRNKGTSQGLGYPPAFFLHWT